MIPLAALLAFWTSSSPQQEPLVFGVGVEVVRVEVLVTRDGQPVPDLTAADFEVRDNGVGQTLHPVVFEEAPVDALLVLDISGSVVGPKLEALQGAAGAFLDGLDTDTGDRAGLVGFQHSVTLALPLTSDLARVRFALEAARGGGRTALHDAVYMALRLPESSPRRSAVVIFSDGLDNMSWPSAGDVVGAASRSGAVVYAVDARGLGDPSHSFLTDVALALVARTVPQVNVFFVGLPLKMGVGIGMLIVTIPITTGWIGRLLSQMGQTVVLVFTR